jgi:aminoglycoside phosphotransferase
MIDPDFSELADFHRLGDDPVPEAVVELAAGRPIELVWRNESGGLTFRFAVEYVKWNPRRSGIDLERERDRLQWMAHRHPVPPVVAFGSDIDEPVLVHGDACAPNTLISADGEWTGHVDVGDLGVGDRWADLAVASLSLDWNFGEGHQAELFDAYGIDSDDGRISYYRSLWELES